MKQQTGDNHIHQSILPPKNIFFMNIPTYKTRDKITITNARYLFALFDIEYRFYLVKLVILMDLLPTTIPDPHTIAHLYFIFCNPMIFISLSVGYPPRVGKGVFLSIIGSFLHHFAPQKPLTYAKSLFFS